MTADHRFRKEDRLRRGVDIERVLARRCSIRGRFVVLHACENELGCTRLGRIVSKRWGKAHERNRYRRWLREAFRLVKADLPTGLDLVVMPLRVEGMGLRVLMDELPSLATQAAAKLHRFTAKE